MTLAIGLVMTEHIVAGLLEDHKLVGNTIRYRGEGEQTDELASMPSGDLLEILASLVATLAADSGEKLDAIGLAVPGVVRHNIIEDSPNLQQIKGLHMGEELGRLLQSRGISAPVHIANDADAIAAGVAATRGHLNRLTRVWTIGNGIGYGRWPYVEGVWEGGHITVSLDPKERFCGCGGVGHLEGIMGYRAMRLRFLDKEPEEVFAAARQGDSKCLEFVDLWHRALAAATASFIHLAGPGKFYFTGHNVKFLELSMLRAHLESMVKMSPLQSFSLEVLEEDDETALIGAGVSALRALTW
ncbi:ROK family protein [Occallatibacter riparius]|uniref:ROK family protein n=1 Tax=Occallatibacter riparius TaxID=1002689 RepID=A0A9J7BYD2_9BACT|nr:ROK family protein [Occallatibacter riparius]UWZ86238.1 ROK family protein [Occallatibacter riparius]